MIIKKGFKITLPDEPYKVETTQNNQIDVWYEGLRYLVVRVEDGKATSIVRGSHEPITDLSNIIEEGNRFFVIDAEEYPFEAAYLSHTYSTEEVPNYIETTEAGEVYEYHYDDNHGVLEQIYFPNSIPVDENNQFGSPARRTHFLTRESVFESFDTILEQVRTARETKDYSEEQAAEVDNFIEWLETARDRYANIEHWKIKFPVVTY